MIDGHIKIFIEFLLAMFALILGITLKEFHLLLSCFSISVITIIAIIKFIFWSKNNQNKNDEKEND